MTELVQYGVGLPSPSEIDVAERVATNLARSGMFKDALQATQAFAKILLGRDLGLSPTQAMTSIHVVEGKPELSANLQAQLVKTYRGPDGERYDFKVGEHTDETCEIRFLRREVGGEWEELGVERFTMADAERAQLTKPSRNGQPSNYVKYPRNMLWARCMSNGVNFHCPEVARGLRVFHEGELDSAPAPTQNGAPVTDIHPPLLDDPAPEPEPDTEPEPEDAVVVLDDERAEGLDKLAHDIVDAEVWSRRKLGTALRGAGATDTSSVGAAIRTLTAEAADELASTMDALLAAHQETQAAA